MTSTGRSLRENLKPRPTVLRRGLSLRFLILIDFASYGGYIYYTAHCVQHHDSEMNKLAEFTLHSL